MKNHEFKEVSSLDLVDVIFERLEPLFWIGITPAEYRQKVGLLYSLNKKQSRQLLKLFQKRHNNVIIGKKIIKLRRGYERYS